MSWTSTSTSRGFGHGSTYSTSYGSTAYVSRSSAGRDTGIGGYTSHKTLGGRPLPSGPGPLDANGKRLSNYNVTPHLDTTTRRNRTPSATRTGPLRANHTLAYNGTSSRVNGTTNDYSRHTSTIATTHQSSFNRRSSITSNPITGTGYDTKPISTGIRTRPLSGSSGARTPNRSTSLSDLSTLSLTDNYRNKGTGGGLRDVNSRYNDNNPAVGLNGNSNTSSRNVNGDTNHYKNGINARSNNNNDDVFRSAKAPSFEDSRPDGTLRTGYTPSMSRETSPTNNNTSLVGTSGLNRRISVERGYSPPKSSQSNQSSSNSPMSTGSEFSGSSGSFPRDARFFAASVSKYRDGGRVGLRNLGNTCFMNSVLQCLSNTRLLLEYCLEDTYQREINVTTSNMKGSLFKAYVSLMQSLWKERSESSVSPTAFKTQIQKFAPRFMGYSYQQLCPLFENTFCQQDSQEFLRYLLEGLHEDVNRVTKKPAPIILDDDALEKKSDSEKAIDYWKAYINRDNSQIVDMFVGQLKSELKFTSCSHRSVTFDPFWDLSVPIPKNRSEINIEDCIRLFMKEEELASEERPTCTKCKQRRACLKMFSIHKFPKILVLHLKRFSQERYGRKLSTLVDFPIKGLDLSEYSAQGGGRRVLYDLYAVSNHSGGTSSGHYTAYCKNPYTSEWHFFNDSRVSPARPNELVSSEAYVLFYELTAHSSKM